MVISQAAECAVRALLYMATFPEGTIVVKRNICRTQHITPAFLIKIMQPLIDKGLVKSHRGITGGFALGRRPQEINLWEIIECIEGPIYLNKCLIQNGYCPRDKNCSVHRVWHKAKAELEQVLRQATLAGLLE